MSKPLTAELIIMKTKAGNLENVKNLNLWGNEIDDVRIVKDMPNLEVLSLSVNKISTLKPFQYCKKLSELYLRKNLVPDLSELRYLQGLPLLKVLWLWDNPCAEVPNYRETVIAALPNLVKLDNQAVTPEERAASSKYEPPKNRVREIEQVKEPEPTRKERDPSPIVRENPSRHNRQRKEPVQDSKNENILCAVLALIKELDETNLEIVRKEVERKIVGAR
ncbi:hypothetical protein SteCoe_17700 [Stentor coeruleus]|uniref:U2A'/phosphoprotein 32 family A C-terminal domain-containing protein n=1 Tax=Stentor coeruleus TaxID=5963 RepID=A0A1R2BYE1_9CILI|nr:hypothetical protein SteCoe_17700 [Stentor coeruleus]